MFCVWVLSGVEEMGFELAAIHRNLAKTLNKDFFPFFVRFLSPAGESLVHGIHRESSQGDPKHQLPNKTEI